MKRKLSALLVICLCAAMLLPGLFSTVKAEETGSWRSELTTVAPGKLTVATSPDFAPYEFYSIGEDGTPALAGFDMELAQYIADYLGLELDIVTVDFDGVLSELQTQSVDLGMAGLSPNEERKKIMDFSDIYYQGGQSLVTIQDRADEIATLDDVNKADYTVGAQIGSIQMDLANEFAADANIVAMPKVTDLISELIAGKEDAAFIEKDVALCYQKNYPQLAIVCDVPYDTEGSAIGVCKGNAALLEGVNEAVAAAVADSSMNQFVANANELATGEKYEGLLEEGKVPGSSGAESAEGTEATEATESIEAAEATEISESAAAEESEIAEAAAVGNYEDLVTVAPGKLTVATSPDFAPYEFYSIGEDGTPALAGFDMELAQYIADYLGLELDIVTVDFDGVLSELQTQSVDLGMAGLSPNEDRKKIMDFSDIYYQGGQSLVTIVDRADEIATLEDVNKADYTVGAQIGSIQMDLANEFAADANIVAMPKVTDLISELIAGKEDAAFIEKDVALCYQKNYPQLAIVCDVPYDTEGSAIGVCKGNATLLAAVNDAVAAAVADSSMNQFVANANELATGEKYEGLLEEGKVPGSSGAESAEAAETEIAEAAESEIADVAGTEISETAELIEAAETEIAEVAPAANSYDNLTTIAPGKLIVATSPDFAPYEFYAIDDAGNPALAGFDMALAQYIADYLGLELELVTVDFDGVLSELQTKSVDLGMAGLSPNEERAKIMDFTEIYYQGGQSLVTTKAHEGEITTLEDANNPEYTVGAQNGSIQLDLANQYAADANIVAMPKVTDIVSELIAGKEACAFIETDVALCYQQNYPDLVVVCDVPYDSEGSAIGVCKDNTVLLAAVNDAIASAVETSNMNRFVADAYELATGNTYEGLLEDGKVPGSAGAESVEATEAAEEAVEEPAEAASETAVEETEAVAADSTETGELAAAVEEEKAANDNRLIKGENFAIVAKYKQLFVSGILVTVLLSIFTVLIGFVLALVLALMRLSNFRPLRFLGLNEEGFEVDGGILAAISKFNPLSFLATAYVEIIRSTPVIVQIFIIYYGVFSLIKLPTFTFWGIRFDRFFPGVVALGLNSGAYLCEIIRSGIQSVDGGQTEAARSLGMSKAKTMRYIILPQAMSNILPAIANEFVVIIKESSITYTIGVQDIMSAVNAVKGAAFVITEPLLVATALYFCLCFPTSKLIAYFERRMSRGNKR